MFGRDGALRKADMSERKGSRIIAYFYPTHMTYCCVKFGDPLPEDLTECREAFCLFGGDASFDLERKPVTIKNGRILYYQHAESRLKPEYLLGYCKIPDIYEFEVNC